MFTVLFSCLSFCLHKLRETIVYSAVRKFKTVYYTDGTTITHYVIFLSSVHTCSLKFMTPVIVLWKVFTQRFLLSAVCVSVSVLNEVHFIFHFLNSKIVPFLLHSSFMAKFCSHNTQ